MDVDGAGVAGVVVTPQLHQQLLPLQGPPPARGHKPKQVELPPGQLHGPAPGAAGAADAIDLQPGKTEPLRVAPAVLADAPQHGPHPQHQLPGAEGLGDVIVGAQLKAFDAVQLLAAGRQHDDGRIVTAADAAAHFPPVHPGEHQVQNDQVGLRAPKRVQRVMAVGRRDDVETFPFQVRGDEAAHVLLVLDDEHFGVLHGTALPPALSINSLKSL